MSTVSTIPSAIEEILRPEEEVDDPFEEDLSLFPGSRDQSV